MLNRVLIAASLLVVCAWVSSVQADGISARLLANALSMPTPLSVDQIHTRNAQAAALAQQQQVQQQQQTQSSAQQSAAVDQMVQDQADDDEADDDADDGDDDDDSDDSDDDSDDVDDEDDADDADTFIEKQEHIPFDIIGQQAQQELSKIPSFPVAFRQGLKLENRIHRKEIAEFKKATAARFKNLWATFHQRIRDAYRRHNANLLSKFGPIHARQQAKLVAYKNARKARRARRRARRAALRARRFQAKINRINRRIAKLRRKLARVRSARRRARIQRRIRRLSKRAARIRRRAARRR